MNSENQYRDVHLTYVGAPRQIPGMLQQWHFGEFEGSNGSFPPVPQTDIQQCGFAAEFLIAARAQTGGVFRIKEGAALWTRTKKSRELHRAGADCVLL